MKKALLIALIPIMLGLSACNTMEGLGRDVEKGGDKLEDSARQNKNY